MAIRPAEVGTPALITSHVVEASAEGSVEALYELIGALKADPDLILIGVWNVESDEVGRFVFQAVWDRV